MVYVFLQSESAVLLIPFIGYISDSSFRSVKSYRSFNKLIRIGYLLAWLMLPPPMIYDLVHYF